MDVGAAPAGRGIRPVEACADPCAVTGAVAGLLLALAVAFVPVLSGRPLLAHLPPPGKKPVTIGTLELITAVVFDVSVFLLVVGVLVVLVHQLARPGEEPRR